MTEQKNMRHWDALSKTDPKHTKPFSRAGGFKGTAMKPIWIVRLMTEHFGPIGEGWGIGKPEFQVIDMTRDTGKIAVYCTVPVWHTDPANTFYGVGGDTVQDQFNNGKTVADDEAFKKAYTDAVNNALKYLGVGGDIHMGQFDDSKYVAEVAADFEPEPEYVEQLADMRARIAKTGSKDELSTLRDEYAEHLLAAKNAPKGNAIYQQTRSALIQRAEELEPSKESEPAE